MELRGGAEEETEEEADGEGKRGISQRYEFAKGIAEAQTSQDIGEVLSRTDHDFYFRSVGLGTLFCHSPVGNAPPGLRRPPASPQPVLRPAPAACQLCRAGDAILPQSRRECTPWAA